MDELGEQDELDAQNYLLHPESNHFARLSVIGWNREH